MNVYDLWSDGANGGRNGTAGGWAFIVEDQDGFKIAISGHEPSTSNNRMELVAVIKGLEHIGDRAIVTVFTDSAYVKNCALRYLQLWKKNGWKGHKGDAIANQDLWLEMDALLKKHFVKWRKVKGHGNSKLNNLVDAMAVAAKKTGTGVVEFL